MEVAQPHACCPPMRMEMSNILCCMCGDLIVSNPSNTCASCLASESDVTRGISTEATLHQCRGCQRWHQGDGKWMACELESRELMGLCLKNVSGLGKAVRLIDAGWIWTEPHSMRIKARLTVQKEVQTATILQQSFVVVFVVRNQQCIECQAQFRQGSWKSLVQVRQRVTHKRTFLYLEQLILKHGAHRGCLTIQTYRDGMDFYFPDKGKAARFISFLESVVPIKIKVSKKLIGTDDKSNISNYKYTNYVEICPLCKDDLLFLPKKMARKLGNISRLVMVKNISNVIHVLDPLTGQTDQMQPDVYWREPIRPIITAARSRLTRYVVLGKEPVLTEQNVSKKAPTRKNRNRLALVTVAKEEDLGLNNVQYEEQSHVGYLMKSGDVCVGYDLTDVQLVEDDAEEARNSGKFPDTVLVRKLYGAVATGEGSSHASRQRLFQLQRLDVDIADTMSERNVKKEVELNDMDEEDFLREVEADRDMRRNMNLYKSLVALKGKTKEDGENNEEEEEEDDQKIKLNELLDGLVLDNDGVDDDMEHSKRNEIQPDKSSGIDEGVKAAMDGISYAGRMAAREAKEKEVAVPVVVFGTEFLNTRVKFV